MKNVYFYPEYFETNGIRYDYHTARGHRLYLDMIAEAKAIKIVRPILEDALSYITTTDPTSNMKHGLEMAIAVLSTRQHDTENDIDTFRKNARIYKF